MLSKKLNKLLRIMRPKSLGIVCYAVLALIPSISHADQLAAKALVDILKQTDAVRADFSQQVRGHEGEILDESSGWMAWSRPGQFRWDVLEPMIQSIVIDEDTYYQFDRDLDQLIIEPLSEGLAVLPATLLSGSIGQVSENYRISELQDEKTGLATSSAFRQFLLEPLNDKSLFTAIYLAFNHYTLKSLKIIDDLGQESDFSFTDHTNNKSISSETFTLKPLATTDVIRN